MLSLHGIDGDMAAVVDRDGPQIYAIAKRVTRNDEVAVTIAGTVLAAARARGSSTPAGRAWSLREAHRLALAHVRDTAGPSTDAMPETGSDGLDAQQAWILHAAYVQGRTYREIAAALDLPPELVAVQMRQALSDLRAAASATG